VRTTLTLDDDLAAKLKALSRKSGKSFKQAVNEAIRTGLALSRERAPEPFKVQARPLGTSGFSYDKVGDLLDAAEGPDRR
jgi:Ribbon-helix-helix protein, copG family